MLRRSRAHRGSVSPAHMLFGDGEHVSTSHACPHSINTRSDAAATSCAPSPLAPKTHETSQRQHSLLAAASEDPRRLRQPSTRRHARVRLHKARHRPLRGPPVGVHAQAVSPLRKPSTQTRPSASIAPACTQARGGQAIADSGRPGRGRAHVRASQRAALPPAPIRPSLPRPHGAVAR